MNIDKLPAWFKTEDGRKFYYENIDGERWVALTRKDVLVFSGEDLGWEEHRIENPDWKQIAETLSKGVTSKDAFKGYDNVVMGHDEMVWLLALALARVEEILVRS